jgi:hypothetical protein
MALDVAPPAPPELGHQNMEDADEYRRDELEGFLHDGAWERAFNEWAEHADLDEEEFAIATDLSLFEQFDFFWDDHADRVGYHAPGIPEDWRDRDLHPDLETWDTVSALNADLTSLGQVVCDVLKDEYIDWKSEYEAPDDLPDFEE